MALSSNVVINFLTKFDKKGLERATKELKGMFIEQSKYVDSIQKKVDELNDENKELLSKDNTP